MIKVVTTNRRMGNEEVRLYKYVTVNYL